MQQQQKITHETAELIPDSAVWNSGKIDVVDRTRSANISAQKKNTH